MKKLFPVAVAATFAAVLVFSACTKKNDNPTGSYTCTCTVTPTGGTATTVALPFSNVTKSQAQTACTDAQTTYSSGGSATCSL